MSVSHLMKNVIPALQMLILFPFFGDDNVLNYEDSFRFLCFLSPLLMPELPPGSFIKHETFLWT
jgi:hypothetical protein